MIRAVEHVRAMRGGAQSHLIRADDGHYYVVKAKNNPQHRRVLVNEWLASGIARALNLSVPKFAAIDVPQALIDTTPALVVRYGGAIRPVAAGPAFGSRLPTSNPSMPVYDYLPEAGLELVENLHEFAGILAVDKWVCNCDGRQVVYCRPKPRHRMRVFFIDHGFAFNAGDWAFPDSPLRGTYCRDLVYANVRGWDSFEPWLSQIERFRPSRLKAIADSPPAEWLMGDDIAGLIDRLIRRRSRVRELIECVRLSARNPFVNWNQPAPAVYFTPPALKRRQEPTVQA